MGALIVGIGFLRWNPGYLVVVILWGPVTTISPDSKPQARGPKLCSFGAPSLPGVLLSSCPGTKAQRSIFQALPIVSIVVPFWGYLIGS